MTRSNVVNGIFKFPEPATKLEFTGERLTRAVRGQIEFEHFHRYCLARDFCYQLDVLDVASGEGYGSAMLATVAKSVVSVEIDQSAIAYAESVYNFDNLKFMHGDALQLPLESASVDVVVSLETLEHVQDHPKFISEVKRVLRPKGVFIVSTPDRNVYSAQHFNQFHKLELSRAEFGSFLQSRFDNVEVIEQRAIYGSLIAALQGGAWRSYERRHMEYIEASDGLSRATYLLGVATDAELPRLASSAYFDLRAPWEAADALERIRDVEHDCLRTKRALEAALVDAKAEVSEVMRERDEYRESLIWERAHAAKTMALIAGMQDRLDEFRHEATLTARSVELGYVRQVAGLVKNQPDHDLPRELLSLKRFLPGRMKRYKGLLRDYRIIKSSPLFEADWYQNTNKDVRNSRIDPVLHYVKYGAKEGRAPGPRFDGAKYLEANPDVRLSGVNPLIHYITAGHAESRPLTKADNDRMSSSLS